MHLRILGSYGALLAGSFILAQAAATDELGKAIKQLADAGSYTWKATSESPQFNMGPTLGKINKDGLAVVSRTRRDNTVRTVHQGDKAAMETEDGWRSLAEMEADQGDNRGRFMAGMLRNFQPPAVEAEGLLKGTKDLTLRDGAYAGTLSEEEVKNLLAFRGRAGGEGPTVTGANGSAKFWIMNGMLKKYEYTVKGTMNFNNQDRDIERTTTVEISDVGSTQVEVPEGAKAKLQ